MPSPLTDAELAVLGLLLETGPIGGYRLLAVVEERGMTRWAGLSASSVYKSLRALVAKSCAAARRDSAKRGRGPVGIVWSATPHGRVLLKRSVARALGEAREQSVSFKLALGLSAAVPRPVFRARIDARIVAMTQRLAQVRKTYRAARHPALPRGARLLFEYALATLRQERAILARLRAIGSK